MTTGQILLTAMFLVLGLGGGLVAILVGLAAVTGGAPYIDDPMDGTLYYDGADWDQPSHVRPYDPAPGDTFSVVDGNLTVNRPPYDWAADATDQGWGGPL